MTACNENYSIEQNYARNNKLICDTMENSQNVGIGLKYVPNYQLRQMFVNLNIAVRNIEFITNYYLLRIRSTIYYYSNYEFLNTVYIK